VTREKRRVFGQAPQELSTCIGPILACLGQNTGQDGILLKERIDATFAYLIHELYISFSTG
jgi:hypothetical protein